MPSQVSFVSSLVAPMLFKDGAGQAGVMWLVDNVKRGGGEGGGGGGGGGICGVNGALPALPVGWQNVSVVVYVEETLQVVGEQDVGCEV